MTMFDFAKDSPFVALLMVWIIAWAFTRPFAYAFKAYNRRMRSRNIAARGWPTNPRMDADGDIIDCDCKDCDYAPVGSPV